MKIKSLHLGLIIFLLVQAFLLQAEDYAPCVPPAAGNWIINADCELTSSVVIRGNVIVQNNATLTINAGIDLVMDLSINNIEVKDGSHIVLKNTGLIHKLMIDDTDGRVGYYLKEVNGPVLRRLNHTTPFYPASTIKVLEHIYALSEVQAGNANLLSSTLTVCPGNKTNCTNNPNTNANCDSTTINESLMTALNRMMFNSDNQSTNAVQEFFGGGNAATGRSLMNQYATNILGLSNQTALQHKLACGNITNNPFNTSTLADLAEIYEEVGENNNVLSGTAKINFYSLMINENNDNGLIPQLNTIIDEENVGVGLSGADINTFKGSINSARKAGNVNCCFSNAGWIELPLNSGVSSKQYVFATFIDSFTSNSVSQNEVAAEMMRKPIREALQSWN